MPLLSVEGRNKVTVANLTPIRFWPPLSGDLQRTRSFMLNGVWRLTGITITLVLCQEERQQPRRSSGGAVTPLLWRRRRDDGGVVQWRLQCLHFQKTPPLQIPPSPGLKRKPPCFSLLFLYFASVWGFQMLCFVLRGGQSGGKAITGLSPPLTARASAPVAH